MFDLERRPIDPREAADRHEDPLVEFRVNIGVVSTAARPAWMPPIGKGGPSAREASVYGRDPLLEPSGDPDWPWHVFDAREPAANAKLAIRLRHGIERALRDMENRSSDRAILDLRLSVAGPLENQSPGAVEELLALANGIGDRQPRDEIIAAQKRSRVPEPEIDALRGGWQPALGQLWPRFRPRRRPPDRLARLLSEARSRRLT